jgi:predicted Zn-dependent protease
MFNYQRRLLSLCFALGVSLSIFLGNIALTQAIPWEQLIFRGVQIMQINSLNDRQEVEIGRQIRQQLITQNKIKLYPEPNLSSYINQIGRKLASVSDRSRIPYRFEIIDSPQVNAFSSMGGFIYVTTGILKTASNEAELAGVIAHEIAHVVGKHSQEQMQQQAVTQGLLTAAGLQQTQMVQLGATLAFNLPHSRQHEYEADQLGLNMVKAAGYAPQPMVDFMRKLAQMGGNKPSLFSTHPNASQRVVALQKQVSKSNGYQGYGTDSQAYRSRIRRLL